MVVVLVQIFWGCRLYPVSPDDRGRHLGIYPAPISGQSVFALFLRHSTDPDDLLCETPVDYQSRKRVARSARSDIHVQGNYDHVWDQCLDALRRINVNIKTIDASKGLIEGTTGLTWRTYGEIVAVHVTKISNDECAVQIRSDSKFAALVVDYGKNASNIEKFFHQLTG